MRRITAILLMVAAAGLCNVGLAADEAKRADIHRLMEASGEIQMMREVMNVWVDQLKSSGGGNLPDAYWGEFESALATDELPNLLVQVYDRHYSHEQILSLIDFYTSPLGQMLVQKTPLIRNDSMYIGQQWASRKSDAIMKRLMPMRDDAGAATPKE